MISHSRSSTRRPAGALPVLAALATATILLAAPALFAAPYDPAACDPVTCDPVAVASVTTVSGPSAPTQSMPHADARSARTGAAQPGSPTDDPAVRQVGDVAVLSRGEVPVRDLLAFVQRATGKPIVWESLSSTAPQPTRRTASAGRTGPGPLDEGATIEVLETIRPVTVPIVEAILASNHIRLTSVVLADGSEVIHAQVDRGAPIASAAPSRSEGSTSRERGPVILGADDSFASLGDRRGLVIIAMKTAHAAEIASLAERMVRGRAIEIRPLGGRRAHHLLLEGDAVSLAAARELIATLDRPDLWPRAGATGRGGSAATDDEESREEVAETAEESSFSPAARRNR